MSFKTRSVTSAWQQNRCLLQRVAGSNTKKVVHQDLGTLVLHLGVRRCHLVTKTLRFTASWAVDYGTSNYGSPEPSSFPVKDMIDIVSDLQTLTDFSQKLMSEEGTNFIDWIVMILSLLV